MKTLLLGWDSVFDAGLHPLPHEQAHCQSCTHTICPYGTTTWKKKNQENCESSHSRPSVAYPWPFPLYRGTFIDCKVLCCKSTKTMKTLLLGWDSVFDAGLHPLPHEQAHSQNLHSHLSPCRTTTWKKKNQGKYDSALDKTLTLGIIQASLALLSLNRVFRFS